jgi:methyl-accepting chemotaxis protein
MKKFKELTIGKKLSLVMSSAICIVLIIFGLYTINSQKKMIIADSDTRLFEQVGDLVNIIDLQIKENQKKVEASGNLAYELFQDGGKLSVDNSNLVSHSVTNQETNNSEVIDLPALLYNGKPLFQSIEFVDRIGSFTQGTNTIFQKFREGYLRISTNITNAAGNRAVNTFIPNSSAVVQTLNRGESYTGRAIILNQWYLTFYKPIKVDNEIVGAYYFGLPEKNLSELKEIFLKKKYYTNGYPFVVAKNGSLLIHPVKKEGESIASESFFKEMVAKGEGKIKYIWEGKSKYQHFKYYPTAELYVATTIYESDLLKVIWETRIATLVAVAIGILIVLLISSLMGRNIQKIIQSINNQIKEVVDAVILGKLKTRSDIMQTNAEFRGITIGFNDTVDALVKPLNLVSGQVEKIGEGIIPQKITDTYYGDFDDLKNNLNRCIDGMQGLVEANRVLQKMAVNDYSEKIDGTFLGLYAEVCNAANLVRERITHVIGISERISNGDLSDREDLVRIGKRSEKDTLVPAFIKMMSAINNMIMDTNKLVTSAVAGKLSTRADASVYQGDFAKVISGVNSTLDAVVGPMSVAADYIARISVGDMPPIITEKYNGDFNIIINNINLLITALNEVTIKAGLVANGDLTVDLKKRSEKDELMQSLTEMVKSTANIIAEFQAASNNISASSQQMSSTSQEMSQGASEQASSAEEVSSSMEEMAANIQQNTENAQQTEKIALNAAEGINKVNVASDQTLRYMQEIADKVSIIGEIARQTNILALNAAVEAARAGEHGKGFAVVAAEVRKLAERSQISAVEIDSLTKNSVRATEESGKLLAAIVPEIGKTAKLVQEIAAASMEQNSGANQVNNAIQQLNQVTQQNAAASEEMATSSEELASQAQQLLDMISFFKLETSEKGKRSFVSNKSSDAQHGADYNEVSAYKADEKTGKFLKNISINLGRESPDTNYDKF